MQKKQPNKFLILSGAGLQMGITIYLFSYLGKWLDIKYPNENGWFNKGFVLFAVFTSMYLLIKQVNKLND